jgi:hypothetical protein
MLKDTNKKHKFNFWDLCVILLVIACIVSVVFRYRETVKWKQLYQNDEYRLYFTIDDIKSSSFTFFEDKKGAPVNVVINEKTIILGNLGAEFERGRAIYTYTETKEDGTKEEKQFFYPESESGDFCAEERCSISGYIVVSGKFTRKGFMLNGETPLSVGQMLNIYTEHINASIKITEIIE